MSRASFFALLLACGSPQHTTTIELAQPLPSVSASAEPTPPPIEETHAASDDDSARDPRAFRTASKTLLEREAPALEQLAAATAATAPDRPVLLLRLAETYVQLRRAGDASASANAIRHFTELTTAYPQFGRIDRAWFGLGFEYEMQGDWVRARRAYYELIKTSPSSTFVPYAYYAFGELFRAEAKTDPSKWSLAQQAYFEVTKFTTSPVAGEALCRLSQVYDAIGDHARAATVRAQLGRDYPSSHAASRCGATP